MAKHILKLHENILALQRNITEIGSSTKASYGSVRMLEEVGKFAESSLKILNENTLLSQEAR